MSLITPADVQALGGDGGLSDADLQTVIDREEAELVRRYGANYSTSPMSETVHGGGRSIYLRRPISSVTSINEYLYLGDTAVVLAATDYYVWANEGRIERIATAGRWGPLVIVSYTPQDDTTLRKQVLIELVRIGASQDTGGTVSGLSFSISSGKGAQDWQAQRESLYGRLCFVGDR